MTGYSKDPTAAMSANVKNDYSTIYNWSSTLCTNSNEAWRLYFINISVVKAYVFFAIYISLFIVLYHEK